MPNEELTTKEAAEVLGVSDQTVVNWWKEGILEGHKLNPTKSNSPLRIDSESVYRLLGEREKTQGGRQGH